MLAPNLAALARILRKRDEGVTAIEYALILSLIAFAIVAGVTAAGVSANIPLQTLANQLQQAVN